MHRRHRIAHLITKLELGGAQQNTLFCMATHDRDSFEPVLLAGAGGILDDEARAVSNAEVHLVPWLVHPVRPWADLVAFFKLRAFLKRERIELVHTHSSKAGILGRLAARSAGVPAIVHTVHGWSFNDTQPAWKRKLYVAAERLAARRTDRLIVVSSRNSEKGLAEGIGRPDQYRTIHSGIHVSAFARPERARAEVRRSLGYTDEHRVVGTIACLKPQKAPLDFVRAAADASRHDPRLRFFVAGDGELLGDVEALVAELGLHDVVQVLGWRRDVIDLYHAMDVFLLTSLFEGLPRAVLQSMAAGVPVVATDVDGTPEVVEHERTGLLIQAGRPDQAAAAVRRMFDEPDLRRGCVERAREKLDRAFEIRQMVRDLDALYRDLLD